MFWFCSFRMSLFYLVIHWLHFLFKSSFSPPCFYRLALYCFLLLLPYFVVVFFTDSFIYLISFHPVSSRWNDHPVFLVLSTVDTFIILVACSWLCVEKEADSLTVNDIYIYRFESSYLHFTLQAAALSASQKEKPLPCFNSQLPKTFLLEILKRNVVSPQESDSSHTSQNMKADFGNLVSFCKLLT